MNTSIDLNNLLKQMTEVVEVAADKSLIFPAFRFHRPIEVFEN